MICAVVSFDKDLFHMLCALGNNFKNPYKEKQIKDNEPYDPFCKSTLRTSI